MKNLLIVFLLICAVQIVPAAILEESPPKIKIWFGGAFYQKDLFRWWKRTEVAPEEKIKIIYDGEKHGVSPGPIIVDEGTSGEKFFTIEEAEDISREFFPGTAIPKTIMVQYSLSKELIPGKHAFSVYAKSSGKFGKQMQVVEKATVFILGGPLRVVAPPLVFPSPFSIRRNKVVTVQYTLSANANVEFNLLNGAGERVKKFSFSAGSEGGRAGINKITWDGTTDQGYLAGNGIYVGTIVGKDENKLLGKAKLAIVD